MAEPTAFAASKPARPAAQLTPVEFEQVRAMIRDYAGIALSPDKQSMVQARLMPRMRELRLSHASEYLALVRAPESHERQEFINLLTTNLTSFFREAHHFELLATWLRQRPDARRCRIWCSAASSGEEVWSIAACVHRALGGPAAQIIGTDIDTEVLEQARAGQYPVESVRSVDRSLLTDFFQLGKGRHAGQVRIGERLRPMVQFARLNLIDAHWSLEGPFDVIFCRNVMIYFDQKTQLELVRRFHALLAPGGLLFVGHSEAFRSLETIFKLIGRSAYKRVD